MLDTPTSSPVFGEESEDIPVRVANLFSIEEVAVDVRRTGVEEKAEWTSDLDETSGRPRTRCGCCTTLEPERS